MNIPLAYYNFPPFNYNVLPLLLNYLHNVERVQRPTSPLQVVLILSVECLLSKNHLLLTIHYSLIHS